MFNFKGFLTQDKNTHLEHLEDDIINRGAVGGDNAINFLKSVRNMLAGTTGSKTNITVKWDGAPAIICGINPENGKFFVGTKSVFNVTPKINYTVRDINKNHGGVVAQKLTVCLQNLSRLNIKGILQGDLLFTNDLKDISINGEKMISFTPNTITYAVPKDSDIGRRIARAKMGIVFHTQYSGKKMDSLSASFGTVTGSSNRSIFLASAAYKETAVLFPKSELSKFDAQIRMAEGSLRKAAPILNLMSKNISDDLSVGYRLKTYFNHFIRNSNSSMDKVAVMQKQFRDYFESVLQNEIDSRKTPKGKEKFIKAKKDGLQFIDRNKQALYFAIASHITLGVAKQTLLQKMNQIQSIGNFIRTSTGYRVTAPEGYVAVDKVAGAIKLVDRLEFSRQNFTMPKGWN
tara:strand:- start:766 stop:1974 length:1209 start_codon:yes stop_codon:yes gene_type:complete